MNDLMNDIEAEILDMCYMLDEAPGITAVEKTIGMCGSQLLALKNGRAAQVTIKLETDKNMWLTSDTRAKMED